MSEPHSVAGALRLALPVLEKAGIDTPRLDAQLLLAWTLGGLRREDLAREPERPLSRRERVIFEKAVLLRAARRPLPYITGKAWFYGRAFKINRAVLIPRPETEMLVAFAHEKLSGDAFRFSHPPRVADIGTGSGCIAVTIACELPGTRVTATDLSPLALRVAAKNVKRYSVGDRCEMRQGDLCVPLAGDKPYDMIVSNPPYVPAADASTLAPEVRDYEPPLALYGDARQSEDPDFPRLLRRRLLDQARAHLASGGWIAVEIGIGQGEQAVFDADTLGYGEVALQNDLAGIPRVLAARMP